MLAREKDTGKLENKYMELRRMTRKPAKPVKPVKDGNAQAITPEQAALVATIQKLFADNADTTSVVSRADDCPELAAVIEAVLPGCQRRSRRHYPVVTLRNVLTNLAKQHFVIDEYGWWGIPGRSL